MNYASFEKSFTCVSEAASARLPAAPPHALPPPTLPLFRPPTYTPTLLLLLKHAPSRLPSLTRYCFCMNAERIRQARQELNPDLSPDVALEPTTLVSDKVMLGQKLGEGSVGLP